MRNRERVLTSLAHRQPDRIPYHVNFTLAAHEAMVRFYGDPEFEKKLGNCFTFFTMETKTCWKEVRPGIWQDEFGVEWNRTIDKDIGVVENLLVTPENVNDFVFPDPADASRYSDYRNLIPNSPDHYYVVDFGFSLFERAWTLAGMENVLMAMIAEKDYAHRLFDRILEFNLAVIERIAQTPADAVLIGDDWGQQTGLIMGPELWREFIGPRVREMYAVMKKKGKQVFIHSCGKVDEIFPDLIDAGLDVFNPFQPEVIDVQAIKKTYGDRLSFYGGVSTQRTLPYGTVAETKEEVKRLLDTVGRNGGYFASPAHSTPADAKPENIAAMIEVLQNQ